MTRRRLMMLMAFVVLCVTAAIARSQGTAPSSITLKTLARVDAGAPVLLGDIAQLMGKATSLSDVPVLGADQLKAGTARVGLLQVRQAVEKAARGSEGSTSFSGSSCLVRVNAARPEAAKPTTGLPPPAPAAAQGETVRDHVRTRIAQACNAEPSDLRLTFEDSDSLLDTPTAGLTVAVAPAAISDRMPINIRVYRGDFLLAQGVARVTVLIRRDVLVTTAALNRGSSVDMESVTPQEQWLPPSILPATRTQVLGSVARARVEAGRVILARDVEAPVVIQRGDLVSIDCLSGTIVVTTNARSKEPGREGDVIQFQSLNSKKTFSARVNGPGKAVLVAEEGRS
jgi:flagella basal body P-ring formation protein FlgA